MKLRNSEIVGFVTCVVAVLLNFFDVVLSEHGGCVAHGGADDGWFD